MDEKTRKPAFWAVLPASVRYDESLSSTAKLFYAEITAMSDATGYCWGSNSYFSRLFGMSVKTVTRLVQTLAERGLVTVEIVKGPKGNVLERRLWISQEAAKVQGGMDKNVPTPMDKNVPRGMDKNVQGNNTSIEQYPPIVPPRGTVKHKSRPDFCPERFAQLWAWYPHEKRGNKQRAIRAWDALQPDDRLIDTIGHALVRQAKTDDWERGIGIPHLSTYLNGAGWEGWDEEEVNARRWTPED